MADTENGQSSSDTTPSTADAFALVGHEIRSEIIRVFGTVDRDKRVIPFGEIRSRLTMDVDPSQLHYHLDKLVGHYIERTEDGYHLRPEGIRLLLTVRGGAFDREQASMWLDADFDCHTCGKPIEAMLGTDGVTIWCAKCENIYGCDFLTMPIGAFRDGPETFSFPHYSKYIIQKSMSIARGVCPNCAHPLRAEFRSNKEIPYDRQVVIDHKCALCKANWMVGVGQALLANPELRSFCDDHGVDLLSTPYWELEFAATDEHMTVHSTDPVEVALALTFDGETLELVVDGDLNVIERNRSSSGDNEASGDNIDLPDSSACLDMLRRHRWPDGVTCPHCDSTETTKEGTTAKGAQRYRCHASNTIFNDLTGTVFAGRLFTLPEMFYIVGEIDETKPAQIARDLDRSYESVLDFVHVVRDNRDDDPGFDLSDVCESTISP